MYNFWSFGIIEIILRNSDNTEFIKPALEGTRTVACYSSAYEHITKTCLCNFDPLKPHFYIVNLGFIGLYITFLISAQKHRLLVRVRTSSPRWFRRLPTIYVLSRNMRYIRILYLKFFIFFGGKIFSMFE